MEKRALLQMFKIARYSAIPPSSFSVSTLSHFFLLHPFTPYLPTPCPTMGSTARAFGSETTNSLWVILLTAWAVLSDAEESCTLSRAVGSLDLALSAVGVPIGNRAPGYVRFPPCLLKQVCASGSEGDGYSLYSGCLW